MTPSITLRKCYCLSFATRKYVTLKEFTNLPLFFRLRKNIVFVLFIYVRCTQNYRITFSFFLVVSANYLLHRNVHCLYSIISNVALFNNIMEACLVLVAETEASATAKGFSRTVRVSRNKTTQQCT